MKFSRLFPIFAIACLIILPACFHDNDDKTDYTQWKLQNDAYLEEIATMTEDGKLVYTPVSPVWDNSFTVYMRWHNKPGEENPSDIRPLSTSTCIVKYTLKNIAGETLDSSANFVCVPNQLVTGFNTALTNMKVNDTVTAVVPYTAGYGMGGYGSVLPYSTLIFGIRLVSINKLM